MREENVNLKPIKCWAIEKPCLPKVEKDRAVGGMKYHKLHYPCIGALAETPLDEKIPCVDSTTNQQYDLEQVTFRLWAAFSSSIKSW